MTTSRLRWIGPAMITVLLSGPAFAAAGLPQQDIKRAAPATPAVQATRTAAAPAPAPAAPAENPPAEDSARYAEREQSAKNLEQFKGGEGLSIYMGGSVLAVVLLLVVLLVLL